MSDPDRIADLGRQLVDAHDAVKVYGRVIDRLTAEVAELTRERDEANGNVTRLKSVHANYARALERYEEDTGFRAENAALLARVEELTRDRDLALKQVEGRDKSYMAYTKSVLENQGIQDAKENILRARVEVLEAALREIEPLYEEGIRASFRGGRKQDQWDDNMSPHQVNIQRASAIARAALAPQKSPEVAGTSAPCSDCDPERAVMCEANSLCVFSGLSDTQREAVVDDTKRPENWPLQSFDGSEWAKEFCRIAAEQGHILDEGWMIGWFSNALMRGYDEHSWRYPQADRDAVVEAAREVIATKEEVSSDEIHLPPRVWLAFKHMELALAALEGRR